MAKINIFDNVSKIKMQIFVCCRPPTIQETRSQGVVDKYFECNKEMPSSIAIQLFNFRVSSILFRPMHYYE